MVQHLRFLSFPRILTPGFLGLFLIVAGLAAVLAAGPVAADHHGADKGKAEDHRAALAALADGDHRSEENLARNQYRNPVDTLLFFTIEPDMTVVEIWPGGGWYTETLAPFVRAHGQFYAAGPDRDSDVPYMQRLNRVFAEKLVADPDHYDHVTVTELAPPDKLHIAPEGSADLVVSFRNLHSWMGRGIAEDVFAAVHRALKPGGVFGLVAHRAAEGSEQDPE
ncbi:MAG: hypothetical protein WEB93_01385, partial [Sphingomonadales bacterium]